MQQVLRSFGGLSVAPPQDGDGLHYQRLVHVYEMLAWGDAGLYLCAPRGGLGAAAVAAAGTPQQQEQFLARFRGEQPVFSAMAITEAHAGSDTSAIRTTAVQDGREWVLNGEKIFVTVPRRPWSTPPASWWCGPRSIRPWAAMGSTR
jgi:alkylation response protein AidB-like acyl-CoA dehydrogenase